MTKVSKQIIPESLAASGTEHGHQAALFCWAATYAQIFPRIRYMFAIPNGGERSITTAGMLKAEGVKRGVPDIFLPLTNRAFAGLFIEMKRPGQIENVRPDQDVYHAYLRQAHYSVVVCDSWQMARDEIIDYIQLA